MTVLKSPKLATRRRSEATYLVDHDESTLCQQPLEVCNRLFGRGIVQGQSRVSRLCLGSGGYR